MEPRAPHGPKENDAYRILGLSRSATDEEIKTAYRRLARQFHPDLNPGNKDAERRFKEVNAAHEIIGTPEARARYDRESEAHEWTAFTGAGGAGSAQHAGPGPFWRTQSGAEARYSSRFAEELGPEFFEGLFGRRAGPPPPSPGEDVLVRMPIGLRDAIHGAEREVQIGTRRLRVRIPPGTRPGQRLRLAGQGAPGEGGGPPGDLYIEPDVQVPPGLELHGADLSAVVSVPLPDAVLGGKARVTTVEGAVELRIPPHTNTGQKLRLRGKGAVAPDGKRGDLIVQLQVVLPEPPDPALEEALRAWAERKAA